MTMPKAYQGKEPYIFISYAHADWQQVEPIIAELQERGFRVWYDEGLPPGENWLEHLAERVTYCGAFMPFLSENFLSSAYCKRELTHAISEDKEPFAVFLKEKLDMTPGMKLLLCSVQGVYRERHSTLSSFMDELCRSHYLTDCRDGEYVPENDRWAPPVPQSEMEAYYLQGKQYYDRLRKRRVHTTAISIDEEDAEEAIKWLTKAAELGHAEAQGMLAWVCGEKGQDGTARFWAEKAADKGLAHGQYVLGDCCMYGSGGMTKNEAAGVAWYRKAALQGDCEAQYYLGRAYEDGMGVAVDRTEARKWYGRAADQGKQLAANALMRMYNEDVEAQEQRNAERWVKTEPKPEPKTEPKPEPEQNAVPQLNLSDKVLQELAERMKAGRPALEKRWKAEERYQKALPYYEKLCADWERGQFEVDDPEKYEEVVAALREAEEMTFPATPESRELLYKLGCCCSRATGSVAEKYRDQAESCFRRAGEGRCGIVDAKYRYALCRSEKHDFETAEEWFLEAAERGHAEAQYHYALCRSKKRDFETAAEWFLKAAEMGVASAKTRLAELGETFYREGQELDGKKDFKMAAEQYLLGAQAGHAKAQFCIGYDYAKGEGVEKNLSEAAKWYRKSAEQGYAGAQNNLANLYYYGNGVEKDYAEAYKWYSEAAAQKNKNSQLGLGRCYENGHGVEKDLTQAMLWYGKAAAQEDKNAQARLGALYYAAEKYKDAVSWLEKAAKQGVAAAQVDLGKCYEYGNGVMRSKLTAKKWYKKAAEQGNALAKLKLSRM